MKMESTYKGQPMYRGTNVETQDPNLHIPGAKDDGGKSRVGLMFSGFANALASVSEVATYGANKYSPNGWIHVPDNINRYTDALLRHLLARASGQDKDYESNLDHLAHAAWNALAILELTIREQERK
jgi:hypothetical protein